MRLLLGFVLVAACGGSKPTAPIAPAPVAAMKAEGLDEKRIVVSQGRKSGTFELTQQSDGSYKVLLHILQNGRGPHVEGTLRLDAGGLVEAFAAKGHYEFGPPISEHFSREGDAAQWKSNEERGEAPVADGAFYVPLAPMPIEFLMVKAAIAAGGTLKLMPAGEVRVAKAGEMTVSAGGQTKTIVAYGISGLDFTTSYVWFDEAGRWFGNVAPWRSYVPEGWESVVDPIVKQQEIFERARDKTVYAAAARKPPAAGIAFTHARVLDVEAGKWLADQTVVVVGDTIKAVGPSAKVKVPAGAETIDLKGQAILPGLIDMHSHTGRADGVLDVASGVTTARDVGNDPDVLDEMKAWFDEGTAVGPRLVRMGFIEGRNEKAAASKVTAETPEEARAAVDYFVKRGYEGIKIYNSMKPELVPILTEAAHAKGLLVTGHIPVHMLAHEAVKAGYDGIEHINMLFLNFLATHDTDTRTTQRFTLIGDKATTLDLKSKPVQDFIALLRERKIVVDPTLIAFGDLFEGEPGKIIPGLEPLIARLPVQMQRYFLVNGLPMEPGKRPLYKAAYEKLLEMVKALFDAKIHLVAGTDWIGGLGMQRELELYVRAGIPPAATLRIATLDAARAMKLDGKLGSIKVGKVADLFILPGDPIADIKALTGVHTVVNRGIVFDSAKLYTAVGVKSN
jgi:imidazolonepropionase-like amidohydrolase